MQCLKSQLKEERENRRRGLEKRRGLRSLTYINSHVSTTENSYQIFSQVFEANNHIDDETCTSDTVFLIRKCIFTEISNS